MKKRAICGSGINKSLMAQLENSTDADKFSLIS